MGDGTIRVVIDLNRNDQDLIKDIPVLNCEVVATFPRRSALGICDQFAWHGCKTKECEESECAFKHNYPTHLKKWRVFRYEIAQQKLLDLRMKATAGIIKSKNNVIMVDPTVAMVKPQFAGKGDSKGSKPPAYSSGKSTHIS